MRTIGLMLGVGVGGCASVDLGPCDEDAAREVVYDEDGPPAFAGQAQLERSCASGVCHTEGATERFGAPIGVDYDLPLASTTIEVAEERVALLDRRQRYVFRTAGTIWTVASSETHPRAPMLLTGPPSYTRYDADGQPIGSLPSIDTDEGDTDEGKEILRDWLACGAPVVERTEPRVDGMSSVVGFTVPACPAAPCPSHY